MNPNAISTPARQGPWSVSALAAAACVTALLGCATGGEPGADSAALAQDLGKEVTAYTATWDTHDSRALAARFTTDADMIMGNGPILEGRTAIDGWWKRYFAAQEPERTLTIEVLSMRPITDEVALMNVRTTTGGRTAEDVPLHPRKARGTWVLVHQDGAWHIASMRGMPTEEDQIIRAGGS
jgi:uncharacterized protein (TIGR02246 family)